MAQMPASAVETPKIAAQGGQALGGFALKNLRFNSFEVGLDLRLRLAQRRVQRQSER